MYRITIIAVGSLKESYWREAEKEYRKRLASDAKIVIKELREVPFRSAADKERILAREADTIMKSIPKDSSVIVLDIAGKAMSSEEFARTIDKRANSGEHLCFVIGGPLGLSEQIRREAALDLSLSSLTFTHQIARVLLFEQLYRALTIIKGRPYHY
ncbi:23S rRNA (pseudouridine(1915)-N(3))-methyltransferase RlmH [Candidatus Uhrbacteria bacterium]|nr:23S rRNA (pseudouridine(1915)-N(3))-methyltransferase RlmH [Candidatus Uhrbacteria bacterium]